MIVAHVAALPLEELISLASAAGAGWMALRPWVQRRGRELG